MPETFSAEASEIPISISIPIPILVPNSQSNILELF